MLKWTKQQQNLQLFQALSHTHSDTPGNLRSSSTQQASSTPNSLAKARRKRYTINNSNLNQHKMPTMTHTLERRLHRRSLDNHLDASLSEQRHSRHSLTGYHNKENFGVHFMRNSIGNTSLTALHDLSNGKSPQRPTEHTPLNIKRFQTAALNAMELTSPNNRDGQPRFSDDFAGEDDATPLSRLKFRNKFKEESLSSSRMGDTTLDRMLDAIIESARKDVKPKCKHKHVQDKQRDDQEYHTNEFREEAKDESIHEMEVRTPQHLKRQKVVRRKNPKNTEKKQKKEKQLAKNTHDGGEIKRITRNTEMIGLTLPNGIPSPETPLFKNSQAHKALLSMETPPQHLTFEVENDLQRCSTPALKDIPTIKRCLSFSCASEEDEDCQHSHKRSSVASSIASSTQEQLSGSASSLTASSVRGSLDVAIYQHHDSLNVHVIRCRDLQRSNGSSNLNAYVKVALIRKSQTEHQGFQRTAVHRHSSRPYFDHCFKFDLSDLLGAVHHELDEDDRLQMAVWHRDRQLKRSEFLGCISFPLSTLLQQKEINGSFKLQTQQCLNKPQSVVTVQPQQATLTKPSLTAAPTPAATHTNHYCQQNQSKSPTTMATTLTQIRNTDDAVSIDSMATGQLGGEQQPMILSKKALHQRDADENLFLRFLELDPPSTEAATGSQGTPVTGRRLSNTKPMGRTPFTMTKKLTRTAERGFGFSIVWTHPPRVEKVEPGLSADRCGIYPGDYVIFVDKHNVVTMPEADVLNLIRSQGATLTLEIFRRSGSGTNAGATGSSANTNTTNTHRSLATTLPMNGKTSRTAASGTSINNPVDEIISVTVSTSGMKQHILANQNRPSTACSVNTTSSLEAAKRRLNLPQVTFSKEVGKGVIV